MFGNESGGDYGELKEQRRAEREDIRGLEKCFKLGIGNDLDKMLDAVKGRYHAPAMPGEPDKITAPIPRSKSGGRAVTASTDEEDDDYVEETQAPVQHARTSSNSGRSVQKYAEIVNELERFRFADDLDKRKKQFAAINVAIRTALQDLIIKDVAQNTKQAFKDHVVEPVYKVSGGIKIIYDFSGQKIAVAARGAFFGDETIYISREGDKIKGGVARTGSEGELEDISGNYSITVERV